MNFFFFLQRRKMRRKRRRRAPLATTISTAAAPKSPLLLYFSKAIAMCHEMCNRTRSTRTKLRSFSSYSFFFFFFSTSLTAALTFLLHKSFSPLSSHSFVSVFLSRVSILREDVKRFGRASFFLFFSSSSFLVASLFSQHPSHRRRVATSPAVVGREPHTRGKSVKVSR